MERPWTKEAISSVQETALFSGVSSADCAMIISNGHYKHLSRRQTLFCAGDPVEQVFLILSGSIKITQLGSNGVEVTLRVIGAGDIVGVLDLWRGCQQSSSAHALQDCMILAWDAPTFTKLLVRFEWSLRNVIGVLEDRLQEMEQRYREVAALDVASRVSSELIRLSSRFRCDVDGNAGLRLTHTDLAQLTGTTLPTISRLLNRWLKLGIISMKRDGLKIRDLGALRQFAQPE